MGRAIAVRTDFTAGEVRRFAKQAKDSGQTRRLLAIAAVLDGASREDAAKTGGMDRQTLRDWVIRFDGPGAGQMPSTFLHRALPPKLSGEKRELLVRLRGGEPDPGGARPRLSALAGMRMSSYAVARGVRPLGVRTTRSVATVKELHSSHVSARPKGLRAGS